MKEEEFEPVLSSDDISMNYKSKVHKGSWLQSERWTPGQTIKEAVIERDIYNS